MPSADAPNHNQLMYRRGGIPVSFSLSVCKACVIDSKQDSKIKGRLLTSSFIAVLLDKENRNGLRYL